MRYWGNDKTVTGTGPSRRDGGRRSSRKDNSSSRASRGSSPRVSLGDSALRSSRGVVSRGSSSRGRRGGSSKQSITSGGSLTNYPFLRKLYEHQPRIGDRVRRLFFFLVLAGLIYVFVLGESGFARIAILRNERSDLDKNIAELARNCELLESEIDRLESDYYYIEKVGREKFGYVRPGDHIYKLIPIDDRDRD